MLSCLNGPEEIEPGMLEPMKRRWVEALVAGGSAIVVATVLWAIMACDKPTPPPETPATEQTSECKSDKDCKGDRICEKGSCTSPR